MAWLNGHMKAWRGMELVLLVVAIIGPWWFDRIVVPSQYPCSAPFVRLDGDFCGIPMPGTWFLWMGILGPFNVVAELVTGTAALADRIGEFRLGMFLLPALPLISGLPMILGRYRRRRQVFHIIVLGLAAGFVLFANSPNFASYGFWALWGLWLYLVIAIGTLMLELLTWNHPKQPIDDHSLAVSSN